jgi:hypothetical protein
LLGFVQAERGEQTGTAGAFGGGEAGLGGGCGHGKVRVAGNQVDCRQQGGAVAGELGEFLGGVGGV